MLHVLHTILLSGLSNSLLFFITIAVLFVIAFVRQGAPGYFSFIISNAFKLNTNKKATKNIVAGEYTSPFYYVIYFFSLSYILLQFSLRKHLFAQTHRLETYFLIVGFLFLFFSFRFIIIKLIAWIFRFDTIAQTFISESNLIDKFIGIGLIPAALVVELLPIKLKMPFLIFIVFIIIIFHITKYLKALGIFKTLYKISFFHLLLYLCALEFVPLLVFYTILHV